MQTKNPIGENKSYFGQVAQELKRNRSMYLLIIPVLVYYFLFCYVPMYGIIMAFQNYKPELGILHSQFVGLRHFKDFFMGGYFWRLIGNTLTISFTSLVFGFPMPIILALMLNEMQTKWLKRGIQTVTYMPHFISVVVIVGILKEFTAADGLIGQMYTHLTGNDVAMLSNPDCFVPIYVLSNIWEGAGWDSIIYLAALAGIDTQLYEACKIDGGGRVRQLFTVTLPGILPTIIVLLILRLGGILNVGYEKIILLYNPINYEKSDVISSYVYRVGMQDFRYGFSTAVGLFNSAIGCIIVFIANTINRKINETSLW